MLEHEPEFLGGVERAALTHDLGQRGAVGEGEGLDDDGLGVVAPARELGALLLVGLGDVQAPARAAALERADDLEALELSRALARLVARRRVGNSLGNAALDAFDERREHEEPCGVPDAQAVRVRADGAEFVLQAAAEVRGGGPAPDDDVDEDQREEDDRGDDPAHDAQERADHAADEREDVLDDPAEPLHERDKDVDEHHDREDDAEYQE